MIGSGWPIAGIGEVAAAEWGGGGPIGVWMYGGMLYCCPKFDAGMLSVGGPEVKNAGVPYSEGEFAVVADMGYCRYSMPYPAEVSMLRFGPMGPGAL